MGALPPFLRWGCRAPPDPPISKQIGRAGIHPGTADLLAPLAPLNGGSGGPLAPQPPEAY